MHLCKCNMMIQLLLMREKKHFTIDTVCEDLFCLITIIYVNVRNQTFEKEKLTSLISIYI